MRKNEDVAKQVNTEYRKIRDFTSTGDLISQSQYGFPKQKRALTRQYSKYSDGKSLYTYDYEYYEYDDEQDEPKFKLISPSELDETFKNQKVKGNIEKTGETQNVYQNIFTATFEPKINNFNQEEKLENVSDGDE